MLARARPWRALAGFWVAVLAFAGAGAVTLGIKGPLPHPAPAPPPPPHIAAEANPAPEPPRVSAPDPALLEASPFPPALLPRIAEDGRAARLVYAGPMPAVPANAPRIALLVAGFGQSERDSRTAIEQMPGPVAFAVSAYADSIDPLLDAARRAGHELLASIPMEPQDYPQNDAGPRSLLTGASPEQNRQNLLWALSRTPGAVGATGATDNAMMGERFAAIAGVFDPMLDAVARRGLLYVDPRPGRVLQRPNLFAAAVDVVIPNQAGRAEIDAKLQALERVARERGTAIGLAGPLRPATMERIAAWTKTLAERGLALVPISAIVNQK